MLVNKRFGSSGTIMDQLAVAGAFLQLDRITPLLADHPVANSATDNGKNLLLFGYCGKELGVSSLATGHQTIRFAEPDFEIESKLTQ